MITRIFALLLLVSMIACGGGGGGNGIDDSVNDDISGISDGSGIDNGSDTGEEENPFEAIAGVWDESREDNEHYVVITLDGFYRIYDYQNDVEGTGENCYVLYEWEMISYGNSEFGFVGLPANYILTITESNDELTTSNDAESGTFPRAIFLETDLTPICEE